MSGTILTVYLLIKKTPTILPMVIYQLCGLFYTTAAKLTYQKVELPTIRLLKNKEKTDSNASLGNVEHVD